MVPPNDPNLSAITVITVAVVGSTGLSGVIVALIGYLGKARSAKGVSPVTNAIVGAVYADRIIGERFLAMFQQFLDELREIKTFMEFGRPLRKAPRRKKKKRQAVSLSKGV